MLSAEWPKTSCIGKRRKREERKKERKEKKKKEKRKKKGKKEKKKRKTRKVKKGVGEAIRNQKEKKITKNHGGVSSDSVYFKSLDFPWNLSVQLVF